MSWNAARRGAALFVAAVALAGPATAQSRHHGAAPAVPHAAAPAPHVAVPRPPQVTPHLAPHMVPRVGATVPHVATPATPRLIVPRTFTPPRMSGISRTPPLSRFHAHRGTRSFAQPALRERPLRHFGAQSGLLRPPSQVGRLANRSFKRSMNRGRLAVPAARRQATPRNRLTKRPIESHAPRRALTDANRGAVVGSSAARTQLPERFDRRQFARRALRGAFVGWFGPVFWPYAYEDIFDYALWPADYDYGPSFWTYAYDDVLGGMFEPYGYAEAVAGEPAARRAGGSGRGAATELCDAQAPELTGWPIARIIATVEPNDAQRAALDELKAAAAEAARLLAGPCPRTLPATPIARLEAIEKRLEAMRQAIDTVAPALAKFYDSLGDEQKARFNGIGRQSNAGDDAARSCPQQPQGLSEQSIRRIAEIVRPTLAQRAALDDLKDASVRAVEALRAACPIEPPLTPPGRIAALRKRLDAMIEATRIERTALVRFYGELSDEQKARMNAMNRPHG